MKFDKSKEFVNEFKKLRKKYKSMNKDLDLFKKLVIKYPLGISRHSHILRNEEFVKVVKSRLFCQYLKKKSLRIVYLYYPESKLILFVEIYYKGSKDREDSSRIKEYLELPKKVSLINNQISNRMVLCQPGYVLRT